ncbi:ornithine--oxo-acid transaminase [Spongiactinospora sp. TRM90649]|uniref:ornithine--oxo-acid transaminase n=1 Tax=Spongiactinospora sp. TRM90649 TaxID=3031114 RepID=UPI0023F6F7EE|nr:ornithine--oxo-acid transaminase [Spongiactinospora sp. TRM90649]MDF5754144.1 ornithine--oxo-acid transaminase [Spongiactinospora sp. TRM90649]
MTQSPRISPTTAALVEQSERRSAHNYHPLPVVIHQAEGAWVTDVEGRRYLDCLAGYSSLNFGHGNPVILAAARAQLDRLTLTSRAFVHDRFADFCAALGDLTGKDMILPMNTGAEAVETAIKVARKWGYEVKGVPDGMATIIVAENNFHGRTTTIVGFSTDPDARNGFGPFAPGFRVVKYGSADAIRDAIDDTTVAVLIEPVQGEAGVLVPPDGYLTQVREICAENRVLMIADEIQSGLGRTGDTFACDHEGVVPDMYVLGKALGGGVVPVSAVAADAAVLGVIRPGQHGSTFGGNPLACAVGIAVVELLSTGEYQTRARELGALLHGRLRGLVGHGLLAVRGRGLWAGIDIDPSLGTGRQVSEALLERGVLVKDTHGSTVRLGPPLVISEEDLMWAVDRLAEALSDLR